jgi:flagellar FliJ protein
MANSSLDMLIELARKAQDAAARTLAENRLSLQQIAAQLETLQQYHHEYRKGLQQALLESGMSPASLSNYRAFLGSLENAVDRAQQTLSRQQQQIDSSQRNWQSQWRTSNAYETLATRREQQFQLQAARTEQRQTDEMASQLRQRRNSFTSSDRSL